jgi:hypothetical protein
METMRQFTVHAEFDAEAKVWCGSNDELPLTTEAPTLDQLLARAAEIAPEIAVMNGLIKRGEEIKIHITAERVATHAA